MVDKAKKRLKALAAVRGISLRAAGNIMAERRQQATTVPNSPTLLASALQRVSSDAVLALVDALLGPSHEWPSELLKYRLSAPFQEDFKEQWGHWLHTAGQHGFQGPLVDRVVKRAKRESKSNGRDPNDKLNLVFAQELAPAMFVHYLCGTGWIFGAWEPITGGAVDVDVQLIAPDGTPVDFQVKSPDQPGEVVNHRIVDGEIDARVVVAVDRAAGQLPKDGPTAKFIAVSANRRWPLSTEPHVLVTNLIGSTLSLGGGTTVLSRQKLGKFALPEWRHVSGVLIVDYLRGNDSFSYPCTVLLNPWAYVQGSASWFPHGRVAVLEGERFRWVNGPPGQFHTLPDGTKLTG